MRVITDARYIITYSPSYNNDEELVCSTFGDMIYYVKMFTKCHYGIKSIRKEYNKKMLYSSKDISELIKDVSSIDREVIDDDWN